MGTTASDRVVLAGVPKVQLFVAEAGRCPESICAPAVMRSLMEYLGESIGCCCRPKGREWGLGCAYAYFMGSMGTAAALARVPGWQESSAALGYLPGDPDEAFRRAFQAVGYPVSVLHKEAGEERYRQEIIASIRDRGCPAISFGIVGPPEPMIITGYDEGGDVLIGWSLYQKQLPYAEGLEHEENGYFRKRGWFEQAGTLITTGAAGERPHGGKTLATALRWNLEIARSTKVRGAATGLAAYDQWIAQLQRDEDFEGQDEATLSYLHDIQNMTVGWVAEVRWYGSIWLVNIYRTLQYDMCEWLLKAAGCWAAEHDLMWKLWGLVGGIEDPDWRLFRQPEIRRQMVPIVQQSRAKFAEAADHIERALGQLR